MSVCPSRLEALFPTAYRNYWSKLKVLKIASTEKVNSSKLCKGNLDTPRFESGNPKFTAFTRHDRRLPTKTFKSDF